MYSKEEILKILSAKKAELKNRYPISELGLFGSYARGDYNDKSDIDILVDFNESIGIEFISLAHELEDTFKVKVDLVSRNGIKPKYLPYVEKNLIHVWKKHQLLLIDIADSIQNIADFTRGFTFESYCSDIKTKHAVEHNFMIIGEAVSRIPEEYKQLHNQINWRQVKDFRNVIVHDYFGIDNNIVWNIIHSNLEGLGKLIVELLNADDVSKA